MHKDLQNSDYQAWLKFLESCENWTAYQVEEYQARQLAQVVSYAYHKIRGYQRLFNEYGVTPAQIHGLRDVQKLPIVTKEDFRDRLEEFSAEWAGREYVTTGGSTGIPFGFYRNPDAFTKELASKAHQYHRIGWKEGDRQLVLRGLPIQSADLMQYVPEFEELRCSSYHLTPKQMGAYVDRANHYGPEWLRCYPSAGYLFARVLDENGLHIPTIRGVLCASENLYDFQRLTLQRVFGPTVFSHYGHYELAVLAGFCETEPTYHVLPQYGYAELIDSRGQAVTKPGEVGEIVATSFLMYATPFIRYRTRDFALLKSYGCERCRRPYQIWERIEGRLQEFVRTRTGRLISMTAINMHDGTFDHVRQFQFHQFEPGKVTLKYVPKKSFDTSAMHYMRGKLLEKLGADMELVMTVVDEIPLTKRGKHRFLVQELNLEYGDV